MPESEFTHEDRMSDQASVTREECEAILNKEPWYICTKCGWHGPSVIDHSRSGPRYCPYEIIEVAHQEKKLARACIALLDSHEQTIQAAEKLAEALKPFAECNRQWMEEGKRAEIRFDWLEHARAALAQWEKCKEGR